MKKHRQCQAENCEHEASFGEKEGKVKHCYAHKADDEISLKNKLCVFKNCKTNATFGLPGGKRNHCKQHAENAEVSLTRKKCVVANCNERPLFAKPPNPPRHCLTHKQTDEINVRRNRNLCKFPDCIFLASFGKSGEKPIHCKKHHTVEEFNVCKRTCTDCSKCPSFGLPEGRIMHCKDHKTDREVNLISKMCAVANCPRQATFAAFGNRPVHCGIHQLQGEIYAQCKSICDTCNSPFHAQGNYKNATLCHYCRDGYQIGFKEKQVLKFLKKSKTLNKFTHNRESADSKTVCGKYRPDFVYDFQTHMVIVECDEFQHKSYDPDCENVRMQNIVYGIGLPCVFIRWNPDDYSINGVKQEVSWKNRIKKLVNTIKTHSKIIPKDMLQIVYLYYDNIPIL